MGVKFNKNNVFSFCIFIIFLKNAPEYIYSSGYLGKPQKGRAIKEKTFFMFFFFILLPFKNENYFTFDNLSKYGLITLKFVGG